MAREIGKPNLREQIDENLRRAFREIVEEPVPDKFKQLLSKLKEQREPDDNAS